MLILCEYKIFISEIKYFFSLIFDINLFLSSSAIAGICGTLAATPFDVVKVRNKFFKIN